MKKVLFTIIVGGLFTTSHLKAQVVLEALDAPTYTVPAGVTLNPGATFFASIYDNDYLPFTQPTAPATWNRPINAGGGNDQLIDYQGTITTGGVTVYIPITSTGNTTLSTFSQQISIPAEYTEDGISRMVELSWEQQSVTSATKNIVATVKAIGGTLNIKKLDLNGGLGNDYKGVLLGRFTYPSSNAGGSDVNYDLRVLSGIPDRRFGVMSTYVKAQDDGTPVTETKYVHQFIYLPIIGPDGKMWLNNNLGAYYSDINSPYFNPMHQAGALDANGNPLTNPTAYQIKTDFRAMGSVFSARIESPPVEIYKRTANSGVIQYLPFVDQTRAAGERCPIGWHTPTAAELLNLQNIITNTNSTLGSYVTTEAMFNESILKLPLAGTSAIIAGVTFYLERVNFIGYYLSSTPDINSIDDRRNYILQFNRGGYYNSILDKYEQYYTSVMSSDMEGSIRCIKD